MTTPTAVKPDRACLLDAIRDNPACDTARLVYADFLDENGEGDRAEFIRVQCELAPLSRFEEDYGVCSSCEGDGLSDPPPNHRRCRRCDGTGKKDHKGYKRAKALVHRERQLLAAHPEWVTLPCRACKGAGRDHITPLPENCRACRGSCDLLKCPRCEGSGKAYGTDRVFNTPDGSGLKCPACTGTGHRVQWERGFGVVRCTSAEVWTRERIIGVPYEDDKEFRTVPTPWSRAVCASEWVIGLTLTDAEPHDGGGFYFWYDDARDMTVIPPSATHCIPKQLVDAMVQAGHWFDYANAKSSLTTADAARTALAWAACRWARGGGA